MSDTIAYVYKWTHIPSLRWYVGSRTAKGCHPGDGYICSSKYVKPLIMESINEWKRDIIATGSPKDMYDLETEILRLFDAKNDARSLNRHNNDGRSVNFGSLRSKETKAKISRKLLGKKQSLATRVKKSKAFSGSGNSFYGKQHSEYSKNLISKKLIGRTVPLEVKKKISMTLTGRSRDEGVKSKISVSLLQLPKTQCPHCLRSFKPAQFGRFHGKKCKENRDGL